MHDIGNDGDCGVGSIGDGLGSASNVVRANNDGRRFAEPSTSTSSSIANNQTEPPRKRQVTVSSYLPKRIRPGDKQYIDKCLVKVIAYDFQPFSIVQDKGFKEYTHALNPNYELPDRKTISNVLMPMVYEERLQYFKDFVKNNAVSVCLTADSWSSKAMDYYMAITAHFLTESLECKSILLKCTHVEGSQTGVYICNEIKKVAVEWDLEKKVILFVTITLRTCYLLQICYSGAIMGVMRTN